MGSHLSKTLQDPPWQPHLDSCSSPPLPSALATPPACHFLDLPTLFPPLGFCISTSFCLERSSPRWLYDFFFFWLPLVLVNSGSFGAAPRLSSCGGWAQCCGEGGVGGLSCPLTCEILVPTPGIEPMSRGHQESPDSLMIHSFASLRSLLKCNLLRAHALTTMDTGAISLSKPALFLLVVLITT